MIPPLFPSLHPPAPPDPIPCNLTVESLHLTGAMSTGRWPPQAESPLARQCRPLLACEPGLLGRIETLTLTGLCGASLRMCPPANFAGA